MAGTGTADALISIRVPRDIVKRAEALRPRMAKDRAIARLEKVTPSTVKLALLRGLAALEAAYK